MVKIFTLIIIKIIIIKKNRCIQHWQKLILIKTDINKP